MINEKKMEEVFNSNPTIGRSKLAAATGVSTATAQRFLQKHKPGIDRDKTVAIKNQHNEAGNTATSISNANRPLSVDEVAVMWNVNQDIWFAKRLITNSWGMTNNSGDAYTNYQTKVIWERKEEAFCLDAALEIFTAEAKKHAPKYKPIKKYPVTKKDNLLEINIRDLHLGKLCWHAETGSNYDSKVAKSRVEKVLKDLISKANAFGFEHIILCASDDFFNSDTIEGMTTSGTTQDDDVRWKKMFYLGRKLMVQVIDSLRMLAPVTVIVVPGNHDTQRSFFLGEVISAWYNKTKNVTINNGPRVRKYYQFGEVMLGFCHGDKEKKANLPTIMANDEPKMWGNTKFREMHIGHLHGKKDIKYIGTEDSQGVTIRQMRSLAGTDNWHYSMGYVGTIKGAEAFIWNKKTGLNAMFESNINVKQREK
jgi:hypothetical protein